MLSQQLSSRSRAAHEISLGVEAAFVRPSAGDYTLGVGVSVALNLFFCWAFLMGSSGDPEPEEPPLEDVQWVALTALGEPPKPDAVPRIVAPPPPPPPEAKAVSLSRQVKEPEEKKTKKPKPKKEEKKKQRKPPQKKKRAKPKKRETVTLNSLFGETSDPRADRGPRKGDKRGHRDGTSSQFQESREMSIYVSRVSTTVNRRLELPSTISPRQLKRLKAEIYIQITSKRKIKGEPRWVKRSGNRFFDKAVMRAVMAFSKEQDGLLPLPRDKELKRHVFKKGLSLIISPNDG